MREALQQARKAEERLRAAIDALPEGVVFLDEEFRYILCNERYSEIYKKSADLFQPGARLTDTLRVGVARGDYPEAEADPEGWIAERLAKLANPQGPHEQLLSDGRWILIEERRMPDGCTIGLRVDVTEIKKREQSFRLLFESNPVPMFLYEASTRKILKANNAACAHYNYGRSDLVGRSLALLESSEAGSGRGDGVALHKRADGQVIDVSTFASDLVYEGVACTLLACVDVTERRRAEARLAHMARHDALTNLPNRVLMREHIEVRLARQSVSPVPFAIILLDLDNFKVVNDTLGHSVGDLLLQEAAHRIQACLGPGDLAARLGGDEFAIVHAGVGPRDNVASLAAGIIAALRRPFFLDGQAVTIGASAGVALAPQHGGCPERLLKCADLALYAAKARGRGMHCFFEPIMDEQLQARRRLEAELREALLEGQLEVHYQPLIDITSGAMSGCEALLRWNHPERGFISPAEFVPIAEETGLIHALGDFVLHRACADAASWPNPIKIAINLSPAQFRTGAVLTKVMNALAASGLAPARLELEITEALLMERDEATLSALNSLRSLGIGISLDDFGTGYSSLIYLRSFPFTKIKIDKSFVSDLAESADNQAIVRAILSLAHSLELDVLAEGVEREEDLAFLKRAGCREAQGFLFSRAQPQEKLFPGLAKAEDSQRKRPTRIRKHRKASLNDQVASKAC